MGHKPLCVKSPKYVLYYTVLRVEPSIRTCMCNMCSLIVVHILRPPQYSAHININNVLSRVIYDYEL